MKARYSRLADRATWTVASVLLLVNVAQPLWTYMPLAQGSYSLVNAVLGSTLVVLGGVRHIAKDQLKTALIILGFVGYSALALQWTPAPLYGREKLLYFIAVTAVPVLGLIFARGYKPVGVVRLLELLGALLLVLQYLHGSLVEGIFGDTNGIWVARFIGICFLASYSVATSTSSETRPLRRFVAWMESGLLGLTVALQGFVGPVIAMVGSIIILDMIKARRSLSRVTMRFIVSGIVVCVVVAYLLLSPSTARELNPLRDVNTLARLQLAQTVLTTGFTNGWALGHGTGSSGWWLLGRDASVYPHNIMLEMWLELGIPGLLLFGAMLYSGYRANRRVGRQGLNDVSMRFVVLYGAFSLLNSFASGDIAHNSGAWLFVALLVARGSQKERYAESTEASLLDVPRHHIEEGGL